MERPCAMMGGLRAAGRKLGGPSARFWLGLAAGGLAGVALGRWRGRAPVTMPHRQAAQDALAATYGAPAAAVWAAKMQTHYEALHAHRPQYPQPALQWHADDRLLPGLAFYQTLRANGVAQDAALHESDAFFRQAFGQTRQLYPLLGRTPDPFGLFRAGVKVLRQLLFPRAGWQMTLYEDNPYAYAFTVHRCFYKDVLTAYGAPELTPLYCQLDDFAFATLPPGILWQRTKTLGRGDDCCDFRWQRANGADNGVPYAATVEEEHPL